METSDHANEFSVSPTSLAGSSINACSSSMVIPYEFSCDSGAIIGASEGPPSLSFGLNLNILRKELTIDDRVGMTVELTVRTLLR